MGARRRRSASTICVFWQGKLGRASEAGGRSRRQVERRDRPIAAVRQNSMQPVASDVLTRVDLKGGDAGLIAIRVCAGTYHAVDCVSGKAGEGVRDNEGHRAIE